MGAWVKAALKLMGEYIITFVAPTALVVWYFLTIMGAKGMVQ